MKKKTINNHESVITVQLHFYVQHVWSNCCIFLLIASFTTQDLQCMPILHIKPPIIIYYRRIDLYAAILCDLKDIMPLGLQ